MPLKYRNIQWQLKNNARILYLQGRQNNQEMAAIHLLAQALEIMDILSSSREGGRGDGAQNKASEVSSFSSIMYIL